eukprot:3332763-Amphidinium_carterae.1
MKISQDFSPEQSWCSRSKRAHFYTWRPGAQHTPYSTHWTGQSIRPRIVLIDRRAGARRNWPGVRSA